MKKLLVAIALGLISFSTIHAQVDPNKIHWHDPFDIYVGPKIGATYSQFTKVGGDPVIFGTAGGFVEVFFTDRFGMNVEMMYTHQGGKGIYHDVRMRTYAEDGSQVYQDVHSGPYDYDLDYINTIYKLKYYFTKQISVFSGFHFGTFINAKSVFQGEKTNFRKYLHRQAAIPIGVSFETEKLMIEACYNFPLRQLANRNQWVNEEKGIKVEDILGNAKQNLFMLTVGYKIKVF